LRGYLSLLAPAEEYCDGSVAGELDESLILLLLDQESAVTKASVRLPMLTNEQPWKRLPAVPAAAQGFSEWARMMAGAMPLTAARMLGMDGPHRTCHWLDGRLWALARWAVAAAGDRDLELHRSRVRSARKKTGRLFRVPGYQANLRVPSIPSVSSAVLSVPPSERVKPMVGLPATKLLSPTPNRRTQFLRRQIVTIIFFDFFGFS
jgi:hypothetical protein